MKSRNIYRSNWFMSMALLVIFAIVGCTGQVNAPTLPPTPSSTGATSAPTLVSVESTATSQPVTDTNVLYQDDFTNPATGWSEDKFDNYFIGYHEPEYYHIEVTSSNSKTTVFEPQKQSFSDATIELDVLTVSAKTATDGDFRYGLVFRRSGDQYYAFTVSPRTKKWFALKSSPNELTVLAEGTDENLHDLDTDDTLRVDAQGSNFLFHINDEVVGEASDPDYVSGEIGFYVESFDSPNTHIHFDNLLIRNLEMPETGEAGSVLIYQDDFTNPATSWPNRKFDNYFIGYHEPEYYHIEVTGPNYKTAVFEPEKRSFGDFTIELQVLTVSAKTAAEGDFRYGLAFRRSGDQYYAFAVSPRTKKWFALKSSPSGLEILQEGVEESIQDLDVDDLLRVDAQGSNFFFHINDQLVGQVTDPDYASGEVGFYVESFDSPNTHIHFDTFTIRELELSLICTVVNDGTLNVRSGSSKAFSQIAVLSNGDSVKALGKSQDGQWIKINVEGSDDPGWVGYTEGFLSCTPTVALFPIVSP